MPPDMPPGLQIFYFLVTSFGPQKTTQSHTDFVLKEPNFPQIRCFYNLLKNTQFYVGAIVCDKAST